MDNAKTRIRPRLSLPMVRDRKVKGYDIAEDLKKYRAATKSDTVLI